MEHHMLMVGMLRLARAFAFLSVSMLAAGSLAGCAAESTDPTLEDSSEEALTGVTAGTYVVDRKPFGTFYVERLTLLAGKKFEADYVSSRGARTTIAGKYILFPARPNNPDSPVKSDKPWIALESDTGPAPNFEIDRLEGGGLRLYHSARQESFTMKKDPSFKPVPTVTKTLQCTGPRVDARLTLDKSENRRGTLKITRKAGATDDDPKSATIGVSITLDEATRDWVHYEGTNGEQDFFFGIVKADLDRATGAAKVNLSWAEFGQEFRVNVDCSFVR